MFNFWIKQSTKLISKFSTSRICLIQEFKLTLWARLLKDTYSRSRILERQDPQVLSLIVTFFSSPGLILISELPLVQHWICRLIRTKSGAGSGSDAHRPGQLSASHLQNRNRTVQSVWHTAHTPHYRQVLSHYEWLPTNLPNPRVYSLQVFSRNILWSPVLSASVPNGSMKLSSVARDWYLDG